MSQQVLLLNVEIIKKMKHFYQDNLAEKLPPGAIFSAKLLKCTITAYKSGKVLFQGENHQEEVAIWREFTNTSNVTSVKNSTEKKKTNLSQYKNLSLIGSDEVGTGDYFGPITVVAAFVAKEQIDQLATLGVKDSKGLTDDKICEIAKELILIIPYSLLILPNEKYNSLQQSGMNQGKLKAVLHNQALLHIKKKLGDTPYDGILIDQFADKNKYNDYISGQKEKVQEVNMFFETKAESLHLSVAAASIIARYAFIKEMNKLSKKAGFEIPKGAGSQVDLAAARLIEKQGVEALASFCKLHFANTEKAKKLRKY